MFQVNHTFVGVGRIDVPLYLSVGIWKTQFSSTTEYVSIAIGANGAKNGTANIVKSCTPGPVCGSGYSICMVNVNVAKYFSASQGGSLHISTTSSTWWPPSTCQRNNSNVYVKYTVATKVLYPSSFPTSQPSGQPTGAPSHTPAVVAPASKSLLSLGADIGIGIVGALVLIGAIAAGYYFNYKRRQKMLEKEMEKTREGSFSFGLENSSELTNDGFNPIYDMPKTALGSDTTARPTFSQAGAKLFSRLSIGGASPTPMLKPTIVRTELEPSSSAAAAAAGGVARASGNVAGATNPLFSPMNPLQSSATQFGRMGKKAPPATQKAPKLDPRDPTEEL